MIKSYLQLNIVVVHAATNNRYADDNDMRLVNLAPIALFSKYKFSTSSRKHVENIEYGHIACLMYIRLATARRCDILSIGSDHSRNRRKEELTNN